MSGLVIVRDWLFVFDKQKTAYEMRISDRSSDVCSSDLRFPPGRDATVQQRDHRAGITAGADQRRRMQLHRVDAKVDRHFRQPRFGLHDGRRFRRKPFEFERSEEHTSELQSLMRISYAVFCLKKKTLHIQFTLSNFYRSYYI